MHRIFSSDQFQSVSGELRVRLAVRKLLLPSLALLFVVGANSLLEPTSHAASCNPQIEVPTFVPSQPSRTFRIQDRVLVLKNGNLFFGHIERTPIQFIVQTDTGNRLVIPLTEAAFTAESVTDAYWQRLASLAASDLAAQEDLFYWCLKYEDHLSAENQLEVLQAIGLSTQKLKYLTERYQGAIRSKADDAALTNGLKQAEAAQRSSQLPSQELAPLPLSNKHFDFFADYEPILSPLPSLETRVANSDRQIRVPPNGEAGKIMQASYQEDSLLAKNATTNQIVAVADDFDSVDDRDNAVEEEAAAVEGELSAVEVKEFIKSLPSGAFVGFRQRVERQLVRNCGDCHRHTSTELTQMPLMFVGKYQPLTSKMTQRNVMAVYPWIDFKNSESSPLLEMAITPHGSLTSPPLGKSSHDFKMLKTWVTELVTATSPDAPKLLATADRGLSRSTPSTPAAAAVTGGVVYNPDPAGILNRSQAPIPLDRLNPASFNSPDSSKASTSAKSAKSAKLENADLGGEGSGLNRMLAAPPGEIPRLQHYGLPILPKDEFDPAIFNRQFSPHGDRK